MTVQPTPPPAYSPATNRPLPTARTPAKTPCSKAPAFGLPHPDSDEWQDGMEQYLERKAAAAAAARGAAGCATPASGTAAPVLAGGAARVAPVLAGGRAATPAGVVPADAAPGATQVKNDWFASLPALQSIVKGSKKAAVSVNTAAALDSLVVVAGLEAEDIRALRKALWCPRTGKAQALTPSQLNHFIALRQQLGAPLTYEQIVAIRAADSARCNKGLGDEDRFAGLLHMYYLDNIDDRRASFKLGTDIMVSEATRTDRETNSLTIVATVRPETTAKTLTGVDDLHIRFHVSRSITDNGEVVDEYKEAVDDIKAIFVDRIVMRHVRNYGQRIVDSGKPNWTNATSLPLSPSAATRMASPSKREPPIPFHPSTPTSSSSHSTSHSTARGKGPIKTDDVFWSASVPAAPVCGACAAHHGDEPSDAVLDAYERAARHARGSLTPTFPLDLALAFPDDPTRWSAYENVRDARGEADLIFAALLSLGLCGRHALKNYSEMHSVCREVPTLAPERRAKPAKLPPGKSQELKNNRVAFHGELDDAAREMRERIQGISKTYKRSEPYVRSQVYGGSKSGRFVRRVMETRLYDAYFHWEALGMNDGLGVGEKFGLEDIREKIARERPNYKNRSADEKRKWLEKYKADKEAKAREKRRNRRGEQQDAAHSLKGVGTDLDTLQARTGVRAVVFAVRSDILSTTEPFLLCDDDFANFFSTALGKTPDQIARMMEMWSIHGPSSLAGAPPKNALELKSETRKLIQTKLDAVIAQRFQGEDAPHVTMNYTSYDSEIEGEYGVRLVGWTMNGGTKVNPGQLPKHEARALFKGLIDGSIYWEVVPADQRGNAPPKKKRKTRSDKNGKHKKAAKTTEGSDAASSSRQSKAKGKGKARSSTPSSDEDGSGGSDSGEE
ncbi:hypothetical protein EXIGLDRAFT_704872 [Exidia glandulosa HHB12029]|uniref:Uncharacterized protein n=1 Tax=Exidia glandulosa HHB12029 TaxID=1314781 RepID=A0A165Z9W2_EXIGL|nr:hypothetical protein EXIGLDRAFT_704872 [Exidia glandulosa HHB12029]